MTERDNVTTAERLPTIVIKDLYKSYGEKKVLKGLNLEVFEGELFGFIGRNGIGKSTTIDCMIGAKQFNGGTITLCGYDVVAQPARGKTLLRIRCERAFVLRSYDRHRLS